MNFIREHSQPAPRRLFLLNVALLCTSVAASAEEPLKLWFDRPTTNWNEALPVGNGRLGAMVFGNPTRERLQLNEEGLWAGCPVDAWPVDFPKHLAEVRRLVLAGQNAEAHAYGVKHLTATPTSFRSYEPLADLWLDFGTAEAPAGFRRELDLADGVVRVSLRQGEATLIREVFVSAPDDVLALRVATDKPGTLTFTARASWPTDARLAAVRQGADDPSLVALHFQFGRYLLMGSSRRPARLPANLQGIWNDRLWAPWEADYHLNINLQMNYWPAGPANLPETVEPLMDWLELLARRGRESARRLYESDGWVAFLATNPFGRVSPSASTLESQFLNASLDPLCGAWVAVGLFDFYQFTGDRAFLQRLYPVLQGASEFVLDTVDIAWEDGRVTNYRVASAQPREVKARIHGEVKTVTSEKL